MLENETTDGSYINVLLLAWLCVTLCDVCNPNLTVCSNQKTMVRQFVNRFWFQLYML